jgi:hypothetical protein
VKKTLCSDFSLEKYERTLKFDAGSSLLIVPRNLWIFLSEGPVQMIMAAAGSSWFLIDHLEVIYDSKLCDCAF